MSGITPKGTIFWQWRLSASILYFQGMSNCNIVLINTVEEIREGFTQSQYEGVNQVRRALDMVRYPSDKDINNTVHASMITNFPVTLEDI